MSKEAMIYCICKWIVWLHAVASHLSWLLQWLSRWYTA
jgi:hypothetical protein